MFDLYGHRVALIGGRAYCEGFCNFKFDNKTNFDTGVVMDGDSRLLTLVHEVTHFDDTFSSNDTWYGTTRSREHAKDARSRFNADSLASYILGVTG